MPTTLLPCPSTFGPLRGANEEYMVSTVYGQNNNIKSYQPLSSISRLQSQGGLSHQP